MVPNYCSTSAAQYPRTHTVQRCTYVSELPDGCGSTTFWVLCAGTSTVPYVASTAHVAPIGWMSWQLALQWCEAVVDNLRTLSQIKLYYRHWAWNEKCIESASAMKEKNLYSNELEYCVHCRSDAYRRVSGVSVTRQTQTQTQIWKQIWRATLTL